LVARSERIVATSMRMGNEDERIANKSTAMVHGVHPHR